MGDRNWREQIDSRSAAGAMFYLGFETLDGGEFEARMHKSGILAVVLVRHKQLIECHLSAGEALRLAGYIRSSVDGGPKREVAIEPGVEQPILEDPESNAQALRDEVEAVNTENARLRGELQAAERTELALRTQLEWLRQGWERDMRGLLQ